MASERKIRRYAAYFHRWATAFGHYDKHFDEKKNLSWLFGENQIGLILTPSVEEFLRPLFLASPEAVQPRIELGRETLRLGDAELRFGKGDQRVLDTVMDLLHGAGDLHLLQTYHLVFPSGTRILTLTRQPPLTIVYREIEPLILRIL